MEGYRSKSCRDHGRTEEHKEPNGMQDLRSYSVSYYPNQFEKEKKIKKGKSNNPGSSSSSNWSFNDPEMQRRKRVAGYKAYTMEGKMKGSFRKSFKWIKDTFVYGWR